MVYFVIVFTILICAFIGFLQYKLSYWRLRGVKQLRKNHLLGNFVNHSSINLSELMQEVYDEFKGTAKLVGTYVYTQPIAVVLDLNLAKSILIKDFNNFIDRSEYQNEKDPLSMHLFMLNGKKWRELRSKLTPAFTSGKMKFMFPTIVSVANEFKTVLDKHIDTTKDKIIEVYDFMGRYTTDVIGTCAFGIECNSLKDPNVLFRRMGKRIFSSKDFSIRWRLFQQTYMNYLKYFGVKRFPKDIEKFIMDIVNETVEARERLDIKRNDFIDILIELKNSTASNGLPVLNMNEMAAQVFIFFAAGFETSSSNLTFGLFELAKSPSIQTKLRNEILEILEKHNGELTYDAMMEMTYLEQFITETLRKYPAVASLTRITAEDYPVLNTDIVLERGVKVMIPLKAIHYDADIYDEPQEFRPERFDSDEVKKRHQQAFLGFGDGPRNCIGLRFGRMQIRIGLMTLLKSFRFSTCEKTPEKLSISKHHFVLTPGTGVWLKIDHI